MATEAEVLKALQGLSQVNGRLFFQHVKTGTSWGGKNEQLRILDGLAVKISWTQPEYHGYEVKVSRSDFLRDSKYLDYLPYCSAFSFVVPRGMVKKTEVPDVAGLVYYYEDGTLHTVKKAPALVVDEARLLSMLRYIVYYRTGSRRQQIAAAVRQATRERQRAAQEEHAATHYRKLYYKAANKLYELGYRGLLEDD